MQVGDKAKDAHLHLVAVCDEEADEPLLTRGATQRRWRTVDEAWELFAAWERLPEAKLAKRLELLFSHACPVLQGRAFAREDHCGALDLQQLRCLRPPPGACAPVAGAVRLVVCDDIIGVERGGETARQLGGACLLDARRPTCPAALLPCCPGGLQAAAPPTLRSGPPRARSVCEARHGLRSSPLADARAEASPPSN